MIIEITDYNEVHSYIRCEESISMELSDYFSFFKDGYRFTPKFKAGFWDGKIRLFRIMLDGGLLYKGLLPYIIKFAKERDYELNWVSDPEEQTTFDRNDILKYPLHGYNGKTKERYPIEPYDYQEDSVKYCVENTRGIVKSATSSGKSLQIYLLLRYFKEKLGNNKRILIIVPTVSLVKQMKSDFGDYSFYDDSWNVDNHVHMVYSGQEKEDQNKYVTVSTWQSIHQLEKDYFDQYDVVICDEVHKAKADRMKAIMEYLTDCKYRFGFTGTIKKLKIDKLSLMGLFGPIHTAITTRELIDSGRGTDIRIKVIALKYSEEYAKAFNEEVREIEYDPITGKKKYSYKNAYKKEMKILSSNNKRNKFIISLAKKLEKNTLLLFKNHEHGEELLKIARRMIPNKKIYYVTGDVHPDVRESIRREAEEYDNVLILATYATFSTGINIKNLHNIIYGVSIKSEYTNIQSIGRLVRLMEGKRMATVYDIADDITCGKRKNYTLKHMENRVEQYSAEQHPFKIIPIKIKA